MTETLPHETPIIFSNEGFYNHVTRHAKADPISATLLQHVVFGSQDHPPHTEPYRYKIRKSQTELRQLCVLHPISQVQIRDFYKKYQDLILHFCQRSPFSIRSPLAVAGTFYSKASWENIHQYKENKVIEEPQDPFTKYSPSFFSYRGYDRMYKFFESDDFFDLEKRFSILWSLDVSKCFDSIYTHCLSWALKDKPFTKKHVGITSTFSQAFDSLMQRANHNETHGIVIGPEVSRIFAELLFQSVDQRAVRNLQRHGLAPGRDFEIRRYVDDVFIFVNTEINARKVYDCYSDALTAFNLHANTSKRTESKRPFITIKSRIIREASQAANEFLEKFLVGDDSAAALIPRKVFDRWRLTRGFLEKIKSICSYNDANYYELSSYLISVFTERVKKLVNVDLAGKPDDVLLGYQTAAIVLLDVIFFLYSVAPSVSASYKLCTSLIVLTRFSDKYLAQFSSTIKQRIFEHAESLLSKENFSTEVKLEGFISLEILNVVLAIKELGHNYRLPERTIRNLFGKEDHLSYFGIIACLFYAGDDPEYKGMTRKLIKSIDRLFSNLSEITSRAEIASLYLDLMGCPYIRSGRKKVWIQRLYRSLRLRQPSVDEVNEFINLPSTEYWFVNWKQLDLLNCLERKELKRAY